MISTLLLRAPLMFALNANIARVRAKQVSFPLENAL